MFFNGIENRNLYLSLLGISEQKIKKLEAKEVDKRLKKVFIKKIKDVDAEISALDKELVEMKSK